MMVSSPPDRRIACLWSEELTTSNYGILGVKIWVFKGEIIPGQEELQAAAARPPGGRRRQPRRRQQFEDRSNDG